jgi:DNA-directed RNA polymerase specialized sigma24 family protein
VSEAGTEAAILREWSSGALAPDEAFAQLYRMYGPVVRTWLAVRAGSFADDLFQDVWTIFYRRTREWEHRTEMTVEDARPVLSFLFRTCHLTLRAHRRLMMRRGDEPLESAREPALDGQLRAFEAIQLGECLTAASLHCSDEDCAVLTAKLAGVPGREIARTLGMTESAVDHRFRRVVERIREVLAPEGDAHV